MQYDDLIFKIPQESPSYREDSYQVICNIIDILDERMKRIPNDLNDACYRQSYIQNHINWFLKNHPDMANDFMREVSAKYPSQEDAPLFAVGT